MACIAGADLAPTEIPSALIMSRVSLQPTTLYHTQLLQSHKLEALQTENHTEVYMASNAKQLMAYSL